jgi:hypothetical protein
MQKPGLLLAVGFAAGFAAGALVWHFAVAAQLRFETRQLREAANQADSLRAENARLTREAVDPTELKRLRDNQTELLRLRAQATQLRQEANDARAAAARAAMRATPASVPADEPPVISYTNQVKARVAWNHTLATGGWRLPSGNRAFLFLKPSPANDGKVVNLRSQIVEVPDASLTSLGLAGFTGTDGEISVFTPEQSQRLGRTLEQVEGATVLAAPELTTLAGRQAQIQMTETHSLPTGGSYTTGPVVDVVPHVAPDGQAVDLQVSVNLDLPRPAR